MNDRIMIGCAGWSVPSAAGQYFPTGGSHLERYASVFNSVEINSAFYRPHRPETYARWRDSVPASFRFSVKVPRTITHQARLEKCEELLLRFASEVSCLEIKLGCLLLQLPPSLQFDAGIAAQFFETLRACLSVPVVCEPRHPSWASTGAANLLTQAGVAYVDADPVVIAVANDHKMAYYRLHGSPVIYHSVYAESYLDAMAARLQSDSQKKSMVWCIFDNTADGAAVPNALSLLSRFR